MNNGEVLIKAEGVSKKFCRNLKRSLWYGFTDIFYRMMGKELSTELRKDEFWAVKEVSFEVRRGECLGLIGHNGAGKSTLLKMLNGLIRPDDGRIEMHGRVGALIELGAGFNPVLTGRENVYVNGSVLGFSKEEIDRKFNEIVTFAELAEFIDMPVQNYSSGMKVRLGFAVAAQMEPDILIIDEVLAVGDMGFVLKCINRIDEIISKACVIFVSHNMAHVSRTCTEVMLLNHGVSTFYSKTISSGIDRYYAEFMDKGGSKIQFDRNKDAVFEFIQFLNRSKGDNMFNRFDDFSVEIGFKLKKNIQNPTVQLIFFDKSQRPVGVCYSDEKVNNKINEEDGLYSYYRWFLTIPRMILSKGNYNVTLVITEANGRQPLLRISSVAQFQMIGKNDNYQPVEFEGIWK